MHTIVILQKKMMTASCTFSLPNSTRGSWLLDVVPHRTFFFETKTLLSKQETFVFKTRFTFLFKTNTFQNICQNNKHTLKTKNMYFHHKNIFFSKTKTTTTFNNNDINLFNSNPFSTNTRSFLTQHSIFTHLPKLVFHLPKLSFTGKKRIFPTPPLPPSPLPFPQPSSCLTPPFHQLFPLSLLKIRALSPSSFSPAFFSKTSLFPETPLFQNPNPLFANPSFSKPSSFNQPPSSLRLLPSFSQPPFSAQAILS